MSRAIVSKPLARKPAPNASAGAATATKKRRGTGAGAKSVATPPDDSALVTTTLRLEAGTRRGLELLQEALSTTLNKLMNEGLAIYVAQRTAALERDVQANLDRIKRYRKTDPTFSKVFAEIAEEEASHGHDDPAQGMPYLETAGPTLKAVRQLIHSRR
jgi:hypothetical protein